MKIKTYLTMMLMCIIFSNHQAAAVNTAADILSRAIEKYQSVPSLTVKFTVETAQNTANGEIVTAGDRFYINLGQMQTWYDGRTQWSYLKSANEVSITEPSVDELAQINPFAMVSAIRGAFHATLVSSGAKYHVVYFTPKNSAGSDISAMTVTFNAKTSWPHKIEITGGNGQMSINVTSVTVGGKLPVSTFVYNKKTHPGAEIIDLR